MAKLHLGSISNQRDKATAACFQSKARGGKAQNPGREWCVCPMVLWCAPCHGVIFLLLCRAAGMGSLINSGGVVIFFAENPQHTGKPANCGEHLTKPRLSSRFCLFCSAKQAKPSPVRRLSTLNSEFRSLKPQNLTRFNHTKFVSSKVRLVNIVTRRRTKRILYQKTQTQRALPERHGKTRDS